MLTPTSTFQKSQSPYKKGGSHYDTSFKGNNKCIRATNTEAALVSLLLTLNIFLPTENLAATIQTSLTNPKLIENLQVTSSTPQ